MSDLRRDTEEKVLEIADEVISGTDLYVVEVKVRGHQGSLVVDVFLDRDGDLDIDALADVNREISFLMDTNDIVKGSYRLNVSSPGVDRPLSLPRQYHKNKGRKMLVRYQSSDSVDIVEVTGTMVASDDDAIVIELNGEDRRRLPYGDIVSAKVKLPW